MSNFEYRKSSLKLSNSPRIQKVNIYKFYIVYKTINLISGKEYIGTHCSNYLTDDYLGSGLELNKDIEELGIENFKRFNIQVFYNHHDMVECENRLINSDYLLRDDTYNAVKGGANMSCSEVDFDYLDVLSTEYSDYEIEDYSKLIDHLCILRNKLIYKPDVKNKLSFQKAAEKYHKLYIHSEICEDQELHDEMDILRKSHDLLNESLETMTIEDIASTGYKSTSVKNRLESLAAIERIKGNLAKYGIFANEKYSMNELLAASVKIHKDYGLTIMPKVAFFGKIFNLKRRRNPRLNFDGYFLEEKN